MSDAIASARALMERRLEEIAEEAGRLERALGHLRSPRTSPGDREPRRNSGKRAPRGQRAEQFMAFVKENPKAGGAEIARAIGAQPSQVYALAGRLEKLGKISKGNNGYRVKSR